MGFYDISKLFNLRFLGEKLLRRFVDTLKTVITIHKQLRLLKS